MKGQWFLISAVIAVSGFLFISGLFKIYFLIDPSDIARMDEDFYLNNVKQQVNNSLLYCPDTVAVDRSLREFRVFAENNINRKGYLFFMNYTYNCNTGRIDPKILVASERMITCYNVSTDDVLPNDVLAFDCTMPPNV